MARPSQGSFDQVFRLRTRNQDIGRNAEIPPVKFLNSGYVLSRFPVEPFMQVTTIVYPPQLFEFFVGMRVDPGPVATQSVRKQNFGGQPRRWNSSLFEESLPLQKRRLKIHGFRSI